MYSFTSRSIIFSVVVLVAAQLTSCDNKPGTVIADIKFSDTELPSSVAEISGFSAPESWGRWSDAGIAPTAKVRFTQPLPTRFTLTLTGQSLPNNETAVVKVGSFQEQIYLQKLSDITTIDVKLNQPEDTIEITSHNPVSPKSLGLNEDTRKLGVGLATMLIEK